MRRAEPCRHADQGWRRLAVRSRAVQPAPASRPYPHRRGARRGALDLLKAWGTGHPGGIGTIHAGTAIGALRRMEQLIQEAVVTVPRALLAETIDLIAVLVRDGHGRRLAELARVEGLDAATGDYRLTPLITPQTGDLPRPTTPSPSGP
nr:ATPase, T2SS/T4P/T4SS family [Caballeronia sp. CLC5]